MQRPAVQRSTSLVPPASNSHCGIVRTPNGWARADHVPLSPRAEALVDNWLEHLEAEREAGFCDSALVERLPRLALVSAREPEAPAEPLLSADPEADLDALLESVGYERA